jgi:ferritin
MALTKKMEAALNKQINAEFASAYLYLSMSAYYENKGLKGFANWMRVQFQEEQFHALRFFDYVMNRGGRVELSPIAEVETEWKGAVEVFESTLNHELKITALINDLFELAVQEKDVATQSLLKWFIDEQVEEESNVNDILNQLKLLGGQGNGLFMLDRELKTRVFTPPVIV